MAKRTNRVAWVVVLAAVVLAGTAVLLKPYWVLRHHPDGAELPGVLPTEQHLRPFQVREGNVWDKFTPKAKRTIFFAQWEAATLGENSVGTEHLLLGLLRERNNVAVRVLERLNVSPDVLRADIEREVVRGPGNKGEEMQLTVDGKKAIDAAIEEAHLLGHDFIGTGHLLLGLIGHHSAPAGGWLARRAIEIEPARLQVAELQDDEKLPASPQP